MRPRHAIGLLVAAILIGVGAASVRAASPARPTSPSQPLKDGCQRSDFGIGFDSSPEWVYVYRNPAIRTASGIVRIAHGAPQDSILQHRSFDFNANLVPDKPFRYLIAGSPSTHMNNFSPGGGEEQGRLHFEWESATLPLFAWPTDGDRATIWGSWIWDCGHWQAGSENNTGTTITGEHSELHPLSAIVVDRRSPYLATRGETQTDVFVSNMGDGAHAVEQCSLTHHPLAGGAFPQYDAGFNPCATDPANRLQSLAKTYTFFVHAPPRPAGSARLTWRAVNRIALESGRQRVQVEKSGIRVTVTLRGAKHQVNYGKTFFVSWSKSPRQRPTTLKVTFRSVLIKHADPNPSVLDPSGANWVLYLDLNGYWQLINNWAPKLTTHVTDGERIAINRTVTIHVPNGGRVWVQIAGRECDEPAGQTILGIHTNLLYPCPANTDELNPNILDVFNNDDPGIVLDTYRSVKAAVGPHTTASVATTHRFPGSGAITFGDGKQGQGDYEVSYVIKRG